MSDNQGLSCSYRFGRTVMMGMEEVMGRIGINAILNLAGLPFLAETYLQPDHNTPISYQHLSAIQQSLEELYGPRGGCGLALQTGRAAFNYGLRDFGTELGLLDLDFRLLPLAVKVPLGLKRLANFLGELCALEINQEETPGQLTWIIAHCPVCWERKTDRAVCHLLVGFAQEYLYWVSGGKYYTVAETSCIAQGAQACQICIDKQAWD